MLRPRVQPSVCARAALVAVLGLSVAGCPSEDAKRADPTGRTDLPGRDAGRSAGAAAMPVDGLRLSLPPGWTATPEGEEALVIGRGGRRIARLSRSTAKSLPTEEALRASLERALASAGANSGTGTGTGTDTESEAARVDALPLGEDASSPHEDTDSVRWLGRVETADAGATYVGLCAKRVGEVGVVLLGTLPGASEADARAALGVCTSLSWGPAPR